MNRREWLKSGGRVLAFFGLAAAPASAVAVADYLSAGKTRRWSERIANGPLRISANRESPYYCETAHQVDVWWNGAPVHSPDMAILEACEGDTDTGWIHQLVLPYHPDANALLQVARTNGGEWGHDGCEFWVRRYGRVELRFRDPTPAPVETAAVIAPTPSAVPAQQTGREWTALRKDMAELREQMADAADDLLSHDEEQFWH